MKCPECLENEQESLCFPAINLELSPKVEGFYDENGIYIEPKQVPLFYACSFGHVFKLQDAKTSSIDEQSMSNMSEPLSVSG